MATEKREVYIKVSSNTGPQMQKATAQTAGLSGALGGVSAAAGAATGGIRAMTAALISSGIGAIVVAIGALVSGFGALISNSKNFEKSLSGLEAITGATTSEMDSLKASAKELGATTKFTAQEVVQLQTEFSKLGFTTAEILDVQAATLDLAAAAGTDLAEAAVVAGATLRGFGLSTKETGRVVDVMAKSFTTSALDMEKFKESMKMVAPIAKTVKVSIESTAGALAVLADRGVSGSMAGTQLRKIMSDLAQKTGKDFQTSLQITAEKLEKAGSTAEKLAIAHELVGDRAKGSLIALAENREEVARLGLIYENAAGSAERMAGVQLDNLSGSLTLLSSAWDGFMLSLEDGSGILNTLARGFVDTVTGFLGLITQNDLLSESMEKSRTQLFVYEGQLDSFDEVIGGAETSEIDLAIAQQGRLELIRTMQKEYPGFLGNIDAEKVSTIELNTAVKDLNKSLVNKIIIQRQQESIDEQAEDTADALMDRMRAEEQALTRTAEARKFFNDMGVTISETDPREAMIAMNAVYEATMDGERNVYEGRKLSGEQIMGMRKNLRLLVKAVGELESEDKDYNKELEKGNGLLAEKNALMAQLGIVDTPEPEVVEPVVVDPYIEGPAEDDAAKKAIADREAFLAKLLKIEQDADDLTTEDKINRKKQRHIDEMKALGFTKDEMAALEISLNKHYDDLIEEDRVKTNNKFKDKIKGDEELTKLEKLQLKRDEHLSELAQLEIDETEKLELKAQIEATYKEKKDLLDQAQAADDEKKRLKEIADAEQVQQAKIKGMYDVLETAADVAGKETQIGKALLALKMAMQIQELISKITTVASGVQAVAAGAQVEATIDGAKTGVAITRGAAESSKVGFPWNVITIASYALQAAMLVKSFIGSKKKLDTVTSSVGGASASSGVSAPSAVQAPSFNVLGATSAGDEMIASTIASTNSKPLRAYVVESEVSSAQALGRNAEGLASMG